MSVHQLKDGRWIIQYRAGEKYKREYFGRGLEAETKARARSDELSPRPYIRRTSPDPAPIFEKLANEYLTARMGSMEESSINALHYKLKGIILPELGNNQALRINPHRIDQYVNKRLKDGVKKTTIHREISDIQAIMNWAVSRGYIKQNPLAGYKKPTRDDEIIQPPTQKEVKEILRHSPEHLIRALIISYYTGLRPGRKELFVLKWIDINWEQKTILVRSAQKGGPSFRVVPIHPAFLRSLKSWYKKTPDKDGLIVHYKGASIKSIKRSFQTAKKKAGIHRRLTPYSFRHAFATDSLAAGADFKSISEILGHSRPDTTTRVYQHTNMAMRRRAINKLPSLD